MEEMAANLHVKEAPKLYCVSKQLFNQNSLNIYYSNGRHLKCTSEY